jgi:hypothetical protein
LIRDQLNFGERVQSLVSFLKRLTEPVVVLQRVQTDLGSGEFQNLNLSETHAQLDQGHLNLLSHRFGFFDFQIDNNLYRFVSFTQFGLLLPNDCPYLLPERLALLVAQDSCSCAQKRKVYLFLIAKSYQVLGGLAILQINVRVVLAQNIRFSDLLNSAYSGVPGEKPAQLQSVYFLVLGLKV